MRKPCRRCGKEKDAGDTARSAYCESCSAGPRCFSCRSLLPPEHPRRLCDRCRERRAVAYRKAVARPRDGILEKFTHQPKRLERIAGYMLCACLEMPLFPQRNR